MINISLKFVSNGPNDNNPALVKIIGNRRQAVIWTNADSIRLRLYAALGGDELKIADLLTQYYKVVLHVVAKYPQKCYHFLSTNLTQPSGEF